MRRLAILLALALVSGGSWTPSARGQEPRTVAETSGYQSTSRYADVMNFCGELAKRSPLARLETFGTSHQGRALPLLVIADPPVSSAEEAAKAGKLVVLAFANIHAGEVDGKEALLALARDLTDRKGHPLLKDLVILLVPILNADYMRGVNTSLRAGITAASQSPSIAAVVMLADMPFVTDSMIATLVDRYRASDAPLIVSDYGGVNAPPMLYDRSLFHELVSMEGEGCGRQVVKRHRDEAVTVSWPSDALADIDVPDDVERIKAAGYAG